MRTTKLTLLTFTLFATLLLALKAQNPQTATIQEALKFEDPNLAYQILKKLDIFEAETEEEAKAQRPFWGSTANKNYCDDHRAYFVNNPGSVFNNNKVVAQNWFKEFGINVIKAAKNGKNIEKDDDIEDEESEGKKGTSRIIELNPEISAFYTDNKYFFRRTVGQQYSCLTQVSSHIPGLLTFNRKDYSADALVKYGDTYKDRLDCFNNDKFFPKTWLLTDKEQCKAFFEEFSSFEYQELKMERNIVYMRKIGARVHEGKGVFPVTEKEEIYLRELYRNGAACGKVKMNNLIQYYIHNPLLLNGHKFDFRVFMLIASSNPAIVYYHDGYLRISLHEYDTTSGELGIHLTNTALSKPIFNQAKKNGAYKGMTEKEIRAKSVWFYNDLQEYLTQQGKITDPNWVENYLRPEIKKAMVHLFRMASGPMLRKSSLAELYGFDFMLDEDLKLWYIEGNSIPLIRGFTPETTRFFNKLLSDTFELMFGMLRSRTKRIITYVNAIIKDGDFWERKDGDIEIYDLEERRGEFKRLTMNRLESEFVPGPTNGFQLIIDENYEGTKRYFGITDEKCL